MLDRTRTRERKRRSRQRRAAGKRLFRIEADECGLVDMLQSTGHLADADWFDPEKIDAALAAYIQDAVARWKRTPDG